MNFRWHDLRHTCASWMVQRGRPLQEVNDFLGQQSIVVTLRHAHLALENLRTAASSLDGVPLSTPTAHEPVASEIPPKKLEVAA